MKLTKILVTAMSLACFTVSAQTCLSGMDATSPDSNFTDNTDGTITDTTTGLMWAKCSIGQAYDATNDICTGEATAMTWQDALQATYGVTLFGNSDWRLPNIKELATLTEKSCVRPAINETLFPLTQSDDYWTSTPSVRELDSAWVVAFFNSSNSLKEKTSEVFVRAVRFAN